MAPRPAPPAATIGELQALLDAFAAPTTITGRTAPCRTEPPPRPSTRPVPRPPPARPHADTHDRVRHDKIDKAGSVTLRVTGRLHHIGVGRTHAGTHVLLLVQDLDIRIVNAATGEILRDLILDPTPRLPTHRPTTRPTHKHKARTREP